MTRGVWIRGLILVLLVIFAGCEEPTNPSRRGSEAPAATQKPAGACEHGLPEGLCPKCDPALAAVFKSKGDWCEEHGFPESYCPICKPDAVFPDVGPPVAPIGDWCVEHGLPESKCTKCNSELVAEYRAAGDWCAEHGFPESVCPICKPQTPPPGAEQAALEARTVRFRSPDVEAAAGIRTESAHRIQAVESVECAARLAFHGDKTADIHAMVPGIVRDVRVELGDAVVIGDALFELESTGVGDVQAALTTARDRSRTAKANLDRKRKLRADEITSEREVELAEQELAAAQTQVAAAKAALRMIGASQASPSGRFTLTTPIAGTVVRRPAVLGSFATDATSLATISDTSVLWVLCDVPESSASRIGLGQTLHLTLDGDRDDTSVEAEITWIAAEVDPRTRTVVAHAELPNPTGRLRANQFGRARIDTGAPLAAVSVPRQAVQRVGKLHVVFVRTGVGVYEPRVVTRHGGDEMVQVEGRVNDGDAVVTTGAVLLRTEIMPGSIGAGCCEVDPPKDD